MNNLKVIIKQAKIYFLTRILSAFASFILFSLAGLELGKADSSRAFSCMFVVGFCIVAARMTVQVGSSLNSNLRISERYRQVARGFAILRLIIPFISLFGSIEIYFYTSNLILSGISFFVITFSSPNIDLIRGVLGKTTIFSFAFLIGTLTSISLIKWIFPHTLDYVVLGFLVQWIFVCLINYRATVRVLRGTYHHKISTRYLFSVLLFSFFDGLILNLPFFGILSSQMQVGIDLSLVTRIFVASLPILPLLIHWTNTNYFKAICSHYSFDQKITLRVLILLTGIIGGLCFMAIYLYFSKKSISIFIPVSYMSLLIGYSIYTSELRFSFEKKAVSFKLPLILLFVIIIYIITLFEIRNLEQFLLPIIIFSQVISFLIAAHILKKVN